MKRLILIVMVLGLVIPMAYAETQTGTARSARELGQVEDWWKLKLLDSHGTYGKNVTRRFEAAGYSFSKTNTVEFPTYGTFIYCVDTKDRGLIKWAYSCGEKTPESAKIKAELAFRSYVGMGTCAASPSIQTLSSE